jgi:hypothetical protein
LGIPRRGHRLPCATSWCPPTPYNAAFGDRRVIAVEVDSHAVYQGIYREPITDAGTAHLDRLTWVTRRQLTELVAQLHPDRHAPITGIIRELIGNI